MAKAEAITIEAAGREVRLSNPTKPYFGEADPPISQRELAEYYVAVAVAAVLHCQGPTRIPTGGHEVPHCFRASPSASRS